VTGRARPAGQAGGGRAGRHVGAPARRRRESTCGRMLTSCSARAWPTARAGFRSRRSMPRRLASMTLRLAGGAGPGSGFGSVKLPRMPNSRGGVSAPARAVFRGRLVTSAVQPAPGSSPAPRDLTARLPWPADGSFDSPGPGRGYVWSDAHEGLPRLAEGRHHRRPGSFVFAGIGRGLFVSLSGPRPPLCTAEIRPRGRRSRRLERDLLALHPARIIEGRVLARQRPAIRAPVISVRAELGGVGRMVTTKFPRRRRGTVPDQPLRG